MLAIVLQFVDACFQSVYVVTQGVYIAGEALNLVAAGHITTFFLKILANVCAHGRAGAARPVADTSCELTEPVCGYVAHDTRQLLLDVRFGILQQLLKIIGQMRIARQLQ